MCRHVIVLPLLHLPLLEKGVIELRNGRICVRHNLSDILKAPPRDDVVEADGGTFMGVNGILQKEVPAIVANITIHNQTTTNHKKILTQVHSLVETFVSLRDNYILNVLHKLKLHEEVKAVHVLYTWDRSHLQIAPPNREVPTLTPRIDAMKYKGD